MSQLAIGSAILTVADPVAARQQQQSHQENLAFCGIDAMITHRVTG
jgi:hypothetical protein